MAYDLSASEILRMTSGSYTPVWTGLPLTVSLWFRVNTTNNFVFWSSLLNSPTFTGIYLETDTSNLAAATAQSGTFNKSTNSTTISTGTWYHAVGVFASTTSRTVYLDGVAGTEDTNSNDPSITSARNLSIGNAQTSNSVNPLDGQVAEVAVWDDELSAAEINALANGYSPATIRPGQLVHYWPCTADLTGGTGQTTPDLLGNSTLTEFGGVLNFVHPSITYPSTYYIPSQVSRYAYNGPLIQQFAPKGVVSPSSTPATPDTYAAQTGQRNVLDFDGSAQDESGSWQFQMPSWYDGSGLLVETLTSMDGTDGDPVSLLVGIGRNDDDTPAEGW